MKILAIGNSFSEDATRYLHDIAKADGQDMKVVNLCIGGCSLFTHYENMMSDSRHYMLQLNGHATGVFVSIREALISDEWDYVTLQQVSHESIRYATFQPYLKALSDYVALNAPKAKQLLHQTWAYKAATPNLCESLHYKTPWEMFTDVKNAYAKAAEESGLPLILGGEGLMNLVKEGLRNVYRDPIHASLGLGRYTLGLVWYGFLTGRALPKDTPWAFDVPITKKEAQAARRCAKRALAEKQIVSK